MKAKYVQYGCGLNAPDGWLNYDASPTLRFERIPGVGRLYSRNASRFPANVRYGDIVKGLPVERGSCAGIYCSHILEHLALDDFDRALANTRAYLQETGTFRLVVPDLEQLIEEYCESDSSDAALQFMKATHLGKKLRPRGLGGFLKEWWGNSHHQWMWDEKAMTAMLRKHGFKSIRRAGFGDAADPKFLEVEEQARFFGCLAMDCRK